MVPPCVEWWCEMENRATTSFGCWASTASVPVQPHCANARRIRCQADLKSFPLGELDQTMDTPPYYVDEDYPAGAGVIESLPEHKQLTWLRIIHSGSLRTHSGAFQKWINEWMNDGRNFKGDCTCIYLDCCVSRICDSVVMCYWRRRIGIGIIIVVGIGGMYLVLLWLRSVESQHEVYDWFTCIEDSYLSSHSVQLVRIWDQDLEYGMPVHYK